MIPKIKTKHVGVFLILLVVLSGVAVGLSNGVFVSGTVTLDAEDGPRIDVVTNSESEMLLDGPDGPNTVDITHDGGSITFISNGSSSATVDTSEISGTTTRVTNIGAPNDLIVDPGDKADISIGGNLDYIEWSDPALDDGSVDFEYSATTETTISPGGFESGQGVVAKDASGTVLDSGFANQDGRVALDLPSGVTEIYLQATPSKLEIRDENAPGELITGINATIGFYPQGDLDEVVTRPAENGTVDMSGLPADQPFVAVASAEGYSNRRIYIDSLIETQDIYLVKDSADTVEIEFELDDFSGLYDESTTVLVVERSINGDWQTVQGDFFGATGRWDATLSRDVRHRLTLKNLENGEEKVVGQFTPQISGVRTITVDPEGSVVISEDSERIFAQPAIGSIEASESAVFGVVIEEGDSEITSYDIEVEHVAPNGTTTTLTNRSGSGAGTEEFTLDLTGLNGTVQGKVDYTTGDGETGIVTLTRSIREHYPAADGLLGGLLEIGQGLGVTPEEGASGVSTMASFLISVLITVGVASSSQASAEVTGLASIGSMAMFNIIGWLPGEVLFAVSAAFGAMLILRRRI